MRAVGEVVRRRRSVGCADLDVGELFFAEATAVGDVAGRLAGEIREPIGAYRGA